MPDKPLEIHATQARGTIIETTCFVHPVIFQERVMSGVRSHLLPKVVQEGKKHKRSRQLLSPDMFYGLAYICLAREALGNLLFRIVSKAVTLGIFTI